ncbi:MAG TPA: glycosyltransferase [Acetobacteraceae bacterium]|nr:glycosyltransferase [Acetobacteraceae bacterium]
MTATVSTIIPAYNAAGTISRTIESALAQTLPPLEILVVDDGSTDATAEIVGRFGPPVRLVRKPNGGPASARNLGAREAQGEWLAMLDADDWWYPDKLARQLALDDDPRIAIIHALASHSRMRVPSEIRFADLWRANLLINSTVLIRRSVFQALGGFDEDRRLISVEDYNLWLRVAESGWRIVTCQEVLIRYTRGIGLSSNAEKFLRASLANAELAGAATRVPPDGIRRKQRQILEEFGRSAMFERQLGRARALFGRSFVAKPSPGAGVRLAASYLPLTVLDARRRAAQYVSAGPPRRIGRRRLFGEPIQPVDFGRLGPILLVIIDTEEEFDWRLVPSPASSVEAMRDQEKAQRIFQRFQLVPTYAVDYAVASQRDGYAPLLDFLSDGSCEIGAQLHPWLNPPITEELSPHNSYPGNLPAPLEAEKIRVLTRTIEDNLRFRPLLYRAGRYGIGPNTARALDSLGYCIDCSVRPYFDLRRHGGFDFRAAPTRPFWFGPGGRILEIPVTVGMTGPLSRFGRELYPAISGAFGRSLRLPGILARTNMLDRVQLTPEGSSLAEAKRLTRTILERDRRQVLVLSYHSPSLRPGNTPYVRSDRDLRRFLAWIEAYLEFFLGEIGGVASTPAALLRLASRIAERSTLAEPAVLLPDARAAAAPRPAE